MSVDSNVNEGMCNLGFLWIIGYVISLFILQACLTTLMIHKKSLNTRLVFSVMVPVSAMAFACGVLTLGIDFGAFSVFDGLGMAIAGAGVFLYNIFEEKP